MKPEQKWLQPGDVVTLGIAGLGEQKQKVVAFKKQAETAPPSAHSRASGNPVF